MFRSLSIVASLTWCLLAAEQPNQFPIDPAVQAQKATALREDEGGASAGRAVIDTKVREEIAAGATVVPVFILLRDQPHKQILELYEEGPARLEREILEDNYRRLATYYTASEEEVRQARVALEEQMLRVRRAAFAEIDRLIGPQQEELVRFLSSLGATHIQRYRAINMLAADVPAAAVDQIASHPLVARISLIEKAQAQLAWSAPALGAPVFWSAGYRGEGEAVAVMDTGIRTSHPAFAGLNIVSKVFLDNGRRDLCFGDDASSPEDRQGHGTHVAGIVASRGAPGWSNYWGVARGLGTLYNLKIGYMNWCTLGGNSSDRDVVNALEWTVQQAPWVKVFNYSYGGDTNEDDDDRARMFDYFADTYGLTISVSAGNESKSGFLGLWIEPGPVSSPGIGYNVIAVAAMNTEGTIDRSDDDVAIFSSRGPTVGGRKKPDLAAPGGLRDRWHLTGWKPEPGIYSAAHDSNGFVAMWGTSMAAPHIAGAAALLRQAGVRDPLAIKALLINTTDQLYWDKDHGWGYANLERAFYQRSNLFTGAIEAGTVLLYKGSASGLVYGTLVWNRYLRGKPSSGVTPCLSDLDLAFYDASSGAELASSRSGIDNVEKTYANLYGSVVVNVTHWSQPACRSPERFALALSRGGFEPAGPRFELSCSVPATVVVGTQFSASCTIANNGNLPAFDVEGTLGLGAGQGTTQSFGMLAPSTSATRSWIVTAPSSAGSWSLQLQARGRGFGAIFSRSASFSFETLSCTVTVAPSSIGVPASGGQYSLTVTAPVGCTWQAQTTASWITFTSGTSGSGNGTVTFRVSANSSTTPRQAIITVGSAQVTVSQAGAQVVAGPEITAVVNGASFTPPMAPGSWVSIFGSRLASTARIWRPEEIVGGMLPTELDGVRVTINGKPAAVYFISPTQLNVQAPDESFSGQVEVRVMTPQGTAVALAEIQPFAPALFLFDAGGRRYPAAQHAAGYGLVCPTGLYPGCSPARPGEVIILYGTGFGPTNPGIPAGRVPWQIAPLANPVQVLIRNVAADVLWAGLVGAGLYQLNVRVPENLPDGEAPIFLHVAGWPILQSGVMLAVQR